MTGDALRFEWERAMRGEGIRPNLRLFLLVLATYMSADGSNCYPSYKSLAADLGMSRTSIWRLSNEAEECGWIRVHLKGGKRRPGEGGSGLTNRYEPLIPEAQPFRAHGTVGEGSAEEQPFRGEAEQPFRGEAEQPFRGHGTQSLREPLRYQSEERTDEEPDAESLPWETADPFELAAIFAANAEEAEHARG
jgi:hypothetical protein